MNSKRNWWRRLSELRRRMWGPMGSVVLHVFAVIALLNFAVTDTVTRAPDTEPVHIQPEADALDPVPELHPQPSPDVLKPPEVTGPVNVTYPTVLGDPEDTSSPIPDPGKGHGLGDGKGEGAGDGDLPGLQIIGAKGPLIMTRFYETRRAGGREEAMKRFADRRINTEDAVLRALRWLKSEQRSDGSWDSPPVAMTGFALLCYLAHGETPASEEFGPTVEKAIKYLASTQASWPRSYQWQIATYALCEAYGMTKVPMLKEVALKGVDVIIKGQRPTGGWCYGLTPTDEADDTSVMGWCAQALKAAQLAGIRHEGLDNAMRKAVRAFKANASPTGGFGYRGPGDGGLTGVGVLCMQLLGAANQTEVQQGLVWLDRATCKWDDAWLGAPLYYWYYVTQAKFHAGGNTWNGWNQQFASELVRNQIVVRGAGSDGSDIGFWELPSKGGQTVKDHSTGLVYNTTLCCLMLEVYYKMLPTYQPPQVQPQETEDPDIMGIHIEISMPARGTDTAG